MTNLILSTDSYKASHWLQVPKGLRYQNSYIEARKGGKWKETVFFGLQMFLKKYFSNPISLNDINEAEEFFITHGEPFNKKGWLHILEKHKGYLPLEIQSVLEGTVVPEGNILVQVINTDPEAYWLTSYVETMLLRAIWYPTTVATNSFQVKKLIWNALLKSSDNPEDEIAFKLHDFGARGVSSKESASIGGAAHLINFMGTDTIEGVLAIRKYYGENMAGFSIPAAEHSTITSWGDSSKEENAYRNILKQFGGKFPLIAVVSDSYDIYNAVKNIWGNTLLNEVKDSGSIIVIRPDSGDPTTVPIKILKLLDDKFGSKVNNKGYRVLNNVRVIQGDGITIDTISTLLKNTIKAGYSIDNLAMGMGGGLLQQINRDTMRFAMKCSAVQVNDYWYDVYKKPITDTSKNSKRGRLALELGVTPGGQAKLHTIRAEASRNNQLKLIWRNGELLQDLKFSEIRKRAGKIFI